MVALVDALEAKGLVQRRPHPDDRRKNLVELTGTGHDTRRRASQASEDAERRFSRHWTGMTPSGSSRRSALSSPRPHDAKVAAASFYPGSGCGRPLFGSSQERGSAMPRQVEARG
jgi:hypothetical protein